MSAVLADLQAKGLLHEKLVVLAAEFGRTPRINDNDGSDERKVFACQLAGAGMKAWAPERPLRQGTHGTAETRRTSAAVLHWWPEA